MERMTYDVHDIKHTTFTRHPNAPKLYTESAVFYAIKTLLNAAGYGVIKKCPGKDGHMLSAPYYIRDRKWKFALIDNESAIRSICEVYNNFEPIELMYVDWE